MTEQASDTNVDQANNNGGNDQLGWRAALPDNLKENEILRGYSNIGDVSKDFLSLKAESANMIKRPGEKASPDEITAFNKAIGVPESADGYEFQRPDGLPEGYGNDTEFDTYFRQSMKEANVPKAAAEALYSKLLQYGGNVFKNQQDDLNNELAEAEKSLRTEWPGTKYDENTEKAKRAIKLLAGDDAEELLKDADAIPAVKKVFSKVFEIIGDDFFIKGEKAGGGGEEEKRTTSGMPMLDFSKSQMPPPR